MSATSSSSSGRRRIGRLVVAAVSSLLVLAATACGGDETSGAEQPTFEFVIPAGAGDRIEAGESLDILPAELVAEIDETIRIVNDDDQPHLLGPWYLDAGETLQQRFTTPGVFDGACSVHPTGEFSIVVRG